LLKTFDLLAIERIMLYGKSHNKLIDESKGNGVGALAAPTLLTSNWKTSAACLLCCYGRTASCCVSATVRSVAACVHGRVNQYWQLWRWDGGGSTTAMTTGAGRNRTNAMDGSSLWSFEESGGRSDKDASIRRHSSAICWLTDGLLTLPAITPFIISLFSASLLRLSDAFPAET